jgi:hypothetical protein
MYIYVYIYIYTFSYIITHTNICIYMYIYLFVHMYINTNQVCAVSSSLIKGALAVHKDVFETFRKSALNFHYEFNIRHLADVFRGVHTC